MPEILLLNGAVLWGRVSLELSIPQLLLSRAMSLPSGISQAPSVRTADERDLFLRISPAGQKQPW
jgi:hypothetical protein